VPTRVEIVPSGVIRRMRSSPYSAATIERSGRKGQADYALQRDGGGLARRKQIRPATSDHRDHTIGVAIDPICGRVGIASASEIETLIGGNCKCAHCSCRVRSRERLDLRSSGSERANAPCCVTSARILPVEGDEHRRVRTYGQRRTPHAAGDSRARVRRRSFRRGCSGQGPSA